MKIEILCTGGSIYKRLFSNTLEALRESGKKGKVVVVRDIRKIVKYGVIVTPALVLNGVVMFSGRLGSPEEIMALLQSSLKSVV
jgi:protein-disulfide isomerase